MSVFLNSTPQDDGNALTGGAILHGGAAEFNVVAFRDTALYLELASGGQFVGIWSSEGTYLETGDTGFSFRWKFWARGSGTVALTQDTDPSWDTSALPSTSIGNLVVSAGGWTVYHVTTGTISLTDFLDGDAIRLGLSLTSGAVDIQTIQLECVPDSGTMGWWSIQPSYDVGPFAATTARSTAQDGITYTGTVNQGDALQVAVDDTIALDILNYAGSDDTSAATSITTVAPSWARTNADVFITGNFDASTNMGASYLSVKVSGSHADPDGTEGTDYIRVPGYTEYDDDINYTRSAANFNNQALSFAVWDDPHIFYESDLGTYQFGDYESLNLKVLVYLGNYQDPLTTTGGFLPTGVPIYEITPADPAQTSAGITLPSSGAFTVWVVAATLRNDITEGDPIVIADPDADVGVFFSGRVALQTDPTKDILAYEPLYYTEHFEAYAQWDPFATPPSGKLKVRLPDNTWRIVGDEAGSDTERLKLQTPDLTWWKEYRTSDGAVATHPLKLYTADGWVVASMMTPE
jgi:hypothetical protein